ncbi:ArsR/SmtB family transcription factor [Arenimonas fontis]|uniref:Helix-turn-helix transcriptional regulator n=1 Tax=Arenimonas fontis TaxID=2608255 RepID=A0A5B2ZBR1_9GAMM|nr:metalloregulator ArsR/SmtB family transcription factor [Arenimonas fontis]KAA2284582.1 helix-turn-helix transcriptional regulator [Arenimonas fontis]
MGRARPRRRRAGGTLLAAAPAFAALGEPVRLHLVGRLCREGPLPVLRLAEDLPISRQAVSKHLDALAEAGLVVGERRGRERIWRLRPERLDEVRRHLDAIAAQWDQALARLRGLVEED